MLIGLLKKVVWLVETNDEERQKKYEDKISLRSLLLKDIDRINQALLSEEKTGMEELENLLSDLPEEIYRSVLPDMKEWTDKLNEEIERIRSGYRTKTVKTSGRVGLNEFNFNRLKSKERREYLSKVHSVRRGYVREVKKLIRWTMDEFGLGLEEEGKKIEEGGL